MVRLFFSIVALALMVACPSAWAQQQSGDDWISVKVETLAPNFRSTRIDLSRTNGRSKAVRLAVQQGSVIIDRLVITYANGQVYFGDLADPVTLRAGQFSDPFDLRFEDKFIDTVDLAYRSAGASQIEIQALQSPAGRAAERPSHIPPTVALGTPAAQSGEREAGSKRADQPKQQPSPPAARHRSLSPPKTTAPTPSTKSRDAGSDDTKPYVTVDVYFGTDRKRETDRQKWDRKLATFGTQSGKKLTLGKAVVTVPKEGRQRGQIIRPEWDLLVAKFSLRNEQLARDFTIFGVDVLEERAWLEAVRKQREQSKLFKDQALVFVHGFNVSFDDAVFRAAQISYDLEFDGVPLLFSWPSIAGVTGYVLDRNRARNAQEYLRQFIELVEKQSGAKEIHLVAHSMGADPLLGALRDMAIAAPAGGRPQKPRFNEVILAAPDVTRDNFEQIAGRIVGLRKGMTLYASSNDRALQISGILTLGEFPAGGVPSNGPLVITGIDTIDVSRANTDFFALNHSTFADRAQLLTDIRGLLGGIRPPNVRLTIYRKVTLADGSAYWRFEP